MILQVLLLWIGAGWWMTQRRSVGRCHRACLSLQACLGRAMPRPQAYNMFLMALGIRLWVGECRRSGGAWPGAQGASRHVRGMTMSTQLAGR